MNIRLLLWPLLLILYIFLLTFNLLELPLYLDEGLYIFWSYLFSKDPAFAYISLQDGKTPLFMWLTTFLNPYFNNYLYTARFISVISSAITLICALIIGAKILGNKNIFLLLMIFLAAPFNILISRLAFVDSLLIALSSIGILGLFLLKESVDKKQILKGLIFACITGIALGLAFMAKTTARIFLAAEIFILIFWSLGYLKKRNFKPAAVVGLSTFIIIGLYFDMLGYIRFGGYRFWEMIGNKEAVLIYTLSEIYNNIFVTRNFETYLKNLSLSSEYFFVYFGPLILFFIAGVYWIIKTKKQFWLLLLTLILVGGVFLSAKIPASRYYAIIIPGFLLIASLGLNWVWQKNSKPLKIISILLLLFSSFLSLKMIFTPLSAYYSSDDQGNFLDYNLNALGLQESIRFLQPNRENIVVGVTGIWGVSEGALVSFEEKGFEVYALNNVITALPKTEEPCEENFKQLNEKCWKIDFGRLNESPKEKYLYLITEQIDIESLKKLADIEVVKEFIRPRTNLNVYLLRGK